MTRPPQYTVRFRVRVGKSFTIDNSKADFEVLGRKVVLSSGNSEATIKESEWLVFLAKGFDSADEAQVFAAKLKLAFSLSAFAAGTGIDAGVDRATGVLVADFKKMIQDETGVLIIDNVHGVSIYPESEKNVILAFNGSAIVSASPEYFLGCVNGIRWENAVLEESDRDLILLMNYALLRPDPVAKIVFAFSAIEGIGQEESWSKKQKDCLRQLSDFACKLELDEVERAELVSSVKRMHRLSLRQGVFRVLNRLGLDHLKKEWDRQYGLRSTLVHGLAPKPGKEYDSYANDVVDLCGYIALKKLACRVPDLESFIHPRFSRLAAPQA